MIPDVRRKAIFLEQEYSHHLLCPLHITDSVRYCASKCPDSRIPHPPRTRHVPATSSRGPSYNSPSNNTLSQLFHCGKDMFVWAVELRSLYYSFDICGPYDGSHRHVRANGQLSRNDHLQRTVSTPRGCYDALWQWPLGSFSSSTSQDSSNRACGSQFGDPPTVPVTMDDNFRKACL